MARPLIIAHRGASLHAVDNSAEAFEGAIAAGADMIEFDVRRTRDDRLVVLHDPTVGGRPVSALTYEEVAHAAGKRPLLLLDEVLDLAGGRIGLDVELKEDGYVARVVDAVRARFEPREVMLTSFLDAVVAQARRLWPEAGAGLLSGTGRDATAQQLLARARACDATAIGLQRELVARDGAGWADAAGLAVHVWTVNEDAELRTLLADERVTGVITDDPARAVALRRDRA